MRLAGFRPVFIGIDNKSWESWDRKDVIDVHPCAESTTCDLFLLFPSGIQFIVFKCIECNWTTPEPAGSQECRVSFFTLDVKRFFLKIESRFFQN